MELDNEDRVSEPPLGHQVGPALSAVASIGGEGESSGQVVQLSLEHLTLRLKSLASWPRPGQAASVRVELGEHWRMALQGEVLEVAAGAAESSSELRLKLLTPPLETGRRIVSFLESLRDRGGLVTPESRPIWEEQIEHAERVARICEAMVSRGCRGLVRRGPGLPPLELKAISYDRYDERMGWRVEGELPRTPFLVEAFGYSSVLHWEVEQAQWEDGLYMLPLPRKLARFRHRWLRRARLEEAFQVAFSHSLWPEVKVKRTLLDVSYEGLSLHTEPSEDLLYMGMVVEDMEVVLASGAPVRLRGVVRNIHNTPGGRRCGMTVTPLTEEDALRWRALVDEYLHPHTRVAGDWHDMVWDLFDRSGYFRLSGKDPSKFKILEEQFRHTQHQLEQFPRLGYRVVRPMKDGVEASFSVLRPYAGTWLGHQLARQQPRREGPRSSRQALRDTYLRCYEPAQMDPNIQWFITYYEAHVRWTRYTQFDFVDWYQHTGQAALIDFRLMEGDTDASLWPPPPEELELGPPTEAEVRRLLELIQRTRPRPYREALDLVPERFDLKEVLQAWGEAKLSREREVVVARRGGQAVAVAVLESAQPGLNLFAVLDGVRLFSFEDDGLPATQDALVALLSHAAGWYRARDRKLFIHYLESEHPEYVERAALADLGEGKLWIISTTLLPEYLEHLCEATTPRADS